MKTIKIVFFMLVVSAITSCEMSRKENQNFRAKVVEITSFKLKSELNAKEFVIMAKEVEKKFLKKQKGFISRTISLDSNGQWTDILFWKNKKHYLKALSKIEKAEVAIPFMNAIDFETLEMKLNEIK